MIRRIGQNQPRRSGSPVPRHFVFVMEDGTYAVQWDVDVVQDLYTGESRDFHDLDYGHPITDFELEQLKSAGLVEHYDRHYVWLYALPERDRFEALPVRERKTGRVKYYYLNTALPPYALAAVRKGLARVGLDDRYSAEKRMGLVAIMNKNGEPFEKLADAETAQTLLKRALPELMKDVAVAFVEVDVSGKPSGESLDDVDVLDLDTLIMAQTQRISEPKTVVCVEDDEDFLEIVGQVLQDLNVEFVPVTTGRDAVNVIEDLVPDVVVLDLMMPDMHGWEVIARMRSNEELAGIPVIIVTALSSEQDKVFALRVAKVHDYLTKPISPARLRQSVWTAINGRQLGIG